METSLPFKSVNIATKTVPRKNAEANHTHVIPGSLQILGTPQHTFGRGWLWSICLSSLAYHFLNQINGFTEIYQK